MRNALAAVLLDAFEQNRRVVAFRISAAVQTAGAGRVVDVLMSKVMLVFVGRPFISQQHGEVLFSVEQIARRAVPFPFGIRRDIRIIVVIGQRAEIHVGILDRIMIILIDLAQRVGQVGLAVNIAEGQRQILIAVLLQPGRDFFFAAAVQRFFRRDRLHELIDLLLDL